MTKKTIAWQIGNTTIRNPYRIKDGLIALKESGLANVKAGAEWDKCFRDELIRHGLLNASDHSDETYSAGRKWRSAFEKLGFIFPRPPKDKSSIGNFRSLSPQGIKLAKASLSIEVEELFTRALSAPVFNCPDGKQTFSPLFWVISILNGLEEREAETHLTFSEFKNIVQTSSTDKYKVDFVVQKLIESRNNSAAENRIVDEFRGDSISAETIRTLSDYADMNLRYLKTTGLFVNYSHGIAPNPLKASIFKEFKKEKIFFKDDDWENKKEKIFFKDDDWENKKDQCVGFPMFFDDALEAREVYLSQLKQAKAEGVEYDASFDLQIADAAQIKEEYNSLYLKCFEHRERKFASQQAGQWQEISRYMDILNLGKKVKRKSEDDEQLSIPTDMKPAYFEWVIWRSLLAIDSLKNSPDEVRKFNVDANYYPIFTAPGGTPDLVAMFEDYQLVVEVTLSENSRQEAMEGEPVRRHVADACKLSKKPTFGLFIARKIHTNTAETFRHGLWYYDNDDLTELQIVPVCLSEFRDWFVWLFQNNVQDKAGQLRLFLEDCLRNKSQFTAPEWKTAVKEAIRRRILLRK